MDVESGARGRPLRRRDAGRGRPGRDGRGVVAQAYCCDVAVHAAEEGVQLHGGIGFTWEHPAHLYLKRAKADQIALGTPAGTAPAWPLSSILGPDRAGQVVTRLSRP